MRGFQDKVGFIWSVADDIVKKFGSTVRRLRSERGFSQESFAHRSGLH